MADLIEESKFSKVTGVDIADLRKIAAQGYFPKAVNSQYEIVASLIGLIKFFQSSGNDRFVGAIGAWAKVLGVEDRTLGRKLAQTGADVHGRKDFTAREVFDALFGELEQAKIKEKQEKIKILTSKRKERDGDLVKYSEIQKYYTEHLIIPVRQLLLSAPTTLDQRVNPNDPPFARRALEAWVNESLKLLTENEHSSKL